MSLHSPVFFRIIKVSYSIFFCEYPLTVGLMMLALLTLSYEGKPGARGLVVAAGNFIHTLDERKFHDHRGRQW